MNGVSWFVIFIALRSLVYVSLLCMQIKFLYQFYIMIFLITHFKIALLIGLKLNIYLYFYIKLSWNSCIFLGLIVLFQPAVDSSKGRPPANQQIPNSSPPPGCSRYFPSKYQLNQWTSNFQPFERFVFHNIDEVAEENALMNTAGTSKFFLWKPTGKVNLSYWPTKITLRRIRGKSYISLR